jgi:hypothetical protein
MQLLCQPPLQAQFPQSSVFCLDKRRFHPQSAQARSRNPAPKWLVRRAKEKKCAKVVRTKVTQL